MNRQKLFGTPKVGGDILSFCTRCKMELAHVIVAMMDMQPVKVICKICHSQHRYRKTGDQDRNPQSPRSPSKPRPRTPSGVSRLWEQKVAENKNETLLYDGQRAFNSGDLINHSMFGLGVVEEIRGAKILVLFKQGEKVLIHGRQK